MLRPSSLRKERRKIENRSHTPRFAKMIIRIRDEILAIEGFCQVTG